MTAEARYYAAACQTDLPNPRTRDGIARQVGHMLALIDRAGWVVSGTVLFWGSVYALGSRHYVRDGLVAVLLSVATFYGFYVGLGIALPAGILQGVL